MPSPTAFDTIESAQEFLTLLREAVEEAKLTAENDVTQTEGRNLDALRMVLYKLEKLEQHLKVSGRLLNDLRTLRRLLLEERVSLPSQNQEVTSRVA
ncbi:MAG TPA: hypothetical protein VMP68_23760 [Candidatus Eisenbacteria bacterium]|nr:hypothetical protein [Candidatus Eisenbacteria bacterium]